MERERHRGTLHSTGLEVIMRYRQRRFPVARACDLSAQGIYVHTTKLTLPTGTLIELELDRWGRHWLIPAVVAREDTQGVELLFRTPQPELFRLESAAMTGPCSQPINEGAAAIAT